MYGKLVHRPPFGHHCHAPRPPFGEPREVGERYLGHPELTDYWIKPYLLEALKHYPRLDDACVVQGLWKFANTICLQNKHTSIRTPPTYDDPVTTHKIAFLDKDDIELGCIKFWRKVDSTFGIDMILNGRGISITGNNDDPTLCLVDTPIGDNKKQIVNIEYLEFSLSALQGLVDGLTDRVEALEDYKGQSDSLIRDPNGNFRTVHTAIHNDSDDQNIPTCYAVYQFGKGISDALNARINNLPSVVDSVQDGNMRPVTSNAVADELSDIRGTLSSLGSRISSIANDVADLQSAINNLSGGSSGGSGSGSGATIQAIWYNGMAPHTTFSPTVGNTYPGEELYLPDGSLPNGTIIGGSGNYICVTASSYYVSEIGNDGPHYGGIKIGTFREIE